MRSLFRLSPFLKPYRVQAFVALLLLFLMVAADLVIPRLTQRVIDEGIMANNLRVVITTSLYMVGASILSVILALINNVLSVNAALGFGANLRSALMRKVQAFSFENLDHLQTGKLLVRSTSDVNTVQLIVMLSLRILTRAPIWAVGAIVLLVLTSPRLARLMMVFVPLIAGLIWLFSRRTQQLFLLMQQQLDRLNTVLQENLAGIRVVKAFVRTAHEIGRFDEANETLTQHTIQVSQLMAVFMPFILLVLNLAVVGAVWFGGRFALAGEMSVGHVVAAINYLAFALFPILLLGSMLGPLAAAKGSAGRILEILVDEPCVRQRVKPLQPGQPLGRIVFDNVSFGYNGNGSEPVLADVSFTAEPGETVAILGATGAGKSTLIHLIPRFYDVTGGRITFDGIDLRDLDLQWLRSNVGVVLQEAVLFSGTVRDNIRYGRMAATDEEVRAAAMAAQGHTFINELPQGYDTVIGQRGVTLSGGQRQRIAIARALLVQPKVLILDDSTSALDIETEIRLQEALDRLISTSRNATTRFIVAQRISTVLLADRILLLDQGRIAAMGTHRQLLAESSMYRDIYRSQLGEPPGEETVAMADRDTAHPAPRVMSGMPGPGGGNLHGRPLERAREAGSTLRRLMHYLQPHRTALIAVTLIAALGTGLTLIAPYLMGLAIDQLAQHDPRALLVQVLLMLAAYVLSAAAQLIQGIVIVRVSQKVMRKLRSDLFAHLQTLSLRFFDARSQGELMSRLTNDMEAISQVLTNNAAQLFTGLLTLAGIMVIIFLLNPWLAAGSMLVFPLMIGLVGLVGKKTRKVFRDYQAHLGELNGVFEETYSGQRVVLAFRQEQSALARFDRANEAVRTAGIKAMTLTLVVMPMMGILSNLNVAVLCGLGGWLAIEGMVSIGTIAAFISYSRRFADPLRQLGNLYNQVQGALAGAERIFELLDTRPDQTDAPQAIELARVTGKVDFEHVNFSYLPGVPVLQDICLHARSGERIALVGHTGAGKTTLINLLSRFYDIDAGTIRIDGLDIRQVSRDSLRRRLGVVLQQSFFFSESVMENIRYGRLDASDEEVVAAARLAYADGFIRRLPRGYATTLSERGESISEGQRQLLSIARAILADPAILILDEATSSVDTRTELFIQQALDELMRGRTSFVIAHRLSTIVRADRVLVIDKGRLVEQGTHDQLLALGGVYSKLFLSQFRGREAEIQ